MKRAEFLIKQVSKSDEQTLVRFFLRYISMTPTTLHSLNEWKQKLIAPTIRVVKII